MNKSIYPLFGLSCAVLSTISFAKQVYEPVFEPRVSSLSSVEVHNGKVFFFGYNDGVLGSYEQGDYGSYIMPNDYSGTPWVRDVASNGVRTLVLGNGSFELIDGELKPTGYLYHSISSVVWDGSRFVGLSYSGELVAENSTGQWETLLGVNFTPDLYSAQLSFEAGRYYAYDRYSQNFSMFDGVNTVSSVLPSTNNALHTEVIYLNDSFLQVIADNSGETGIALQFSYDGVTWASENVELPSTVANVYDVELIKVGGVAYLAILDGFSDVVRVFESQDGYNWHLVRNAKVIGEAIHSINNFSYLDGAFYFSSDSDLYLLNDDYSLKVVYSAEVPDILALAGNESHVVVTKLQKNASRLTIASSADKGVSWSEVPAETPARWNGTEFVALNSTHIWTSADGISWQQSSALPEKIGLSYFHASGSTYIRQQGLGRYSLSSSPIKYSLDKGISWSILKHSVLDGVDYLSVAELLEVNGIAVVVIEAQEGNSYGQLNTKFITLKSSGDGWELVDIQPVNSYAKLALLKEVNGSFFRLIGNTSVAYSDDGINWLPIPGINAENVYYRAGFYQKGGKFYFNCDYHCYSSVDGINWSIEPIPESLPSFNYFSSNKLEQAEVGGAFFYLTANKLYKSIDIDPLVFDFDKDGIPDFFEQQLGLNSHDFRDAVQDSDLDGLSNLQEYLLGSNLNTSDTDSDGLTDAQEVTLGTSLTNSDTDDDGLTDKQEIENGLDPTVKNQLGDDTDGDGVPDVIEVTLNTSPKNASSFPRAVANSLANQSFWLSSASIATTEAPEAAKLQFNSDQSGLIIEEGEVSLTWSENVGIYLVETPDAIPETRTETRWDKTVGTQIDVLIEESVQAMWIVGSNDGEYDDVNVVAVTKVIERVSGSPDVTRFEFEKNQMSLVFSTDYQFFSPKGKVITTDVAVLQQTQNSQELVMAPGQLSFFENGTGELIADDFSYSHKANTAPYQQLEYTIARSNDGVVKLSFTWSIVSNNQLKVTYSNNVVQTFSLTRQIKGQWLALSSAEVAGTDRIAHYQYFISSQGLSQLQPLTGLRVIYHSTRNNWSGEPRAINFISDDMARVEVFRDGQWVSNGGANANVAYLDGLVKLSWVVGYDGDVWSSSNRAWPSNGTCDGLMQCNEIEVFEFNIIQSDDEGLFLVESGAFAYSEGRLVKSDGYHAVRRYLIEGVVISNDTDGDGIPDVYDLDDDNDGLTDDFEKFYGLDAKRANANVDTDNDGLTNFREFELGTNPSVSDTDGDGVIDSLDKYPTDASKFNDSLATMDINGNKTSDSLWYNTQTGQQWGYRLVDGQQAYGGFVNQAPLAWPIAALGDFNGDGLVDQLFRHQTSGELWVHLLNDGVSVSNQGLTVVSSPDWQVVAVGDFDGDADDDVIWRNRVTGDVYQYRMAGHGFVGQSLPMEANLNKHIVGSGDFNGDGTTDLLWRDKVTGTNSLQLFVDGVVAQGVALPSEANQAWQVQGVADINGDGRADTIWRNSESGMLWGYLTQADFSFGNRPIDISKSLSWQVLDVADYNGDGLGDLLWLNTETQVLSTSLLNSGLEHEVATIASRDWQYVTRLGVQVADKPKVKSDLDGDGKADILWQHQDNSHVYGYLMDGHHKASEGYINQPPQGWKVEGRGDLDGDGKDDIILRHKDSGQVHIYLQNGLQQKRSEGFLIVPHEWQLAGVGDLNGDSNADLLWRNQTTGSNYVYLMNGVSRIDEGEVNQVADLNWQVVTVDDVDGDKKADIIWRHRETGRVYQYLMNGKTIALQGDLLTESQLAWALVGAGDVNGDGQADLIYRNSDTGQNYIYFLKGGKVEKGMMLNTEADQDWQLVDVLDMDGDGTEDLLWRHMRRGDIYQFLMKEGRIGSAQQLPGVSDLSWRVMH